MTNELETRLWAAADGARQVAAAYDTDALLDRIETDARRPAWLAPAVAVAAAAVVFAVVAVVAGLGTPAPRITDPAGTASPSDGETAAPSPQPTTPPEATAPATVPPSPVGACSAAGLDPVVSPQPDLPEAVGALREEIARAAATCDLTALGRLLDPASFSYSFGVDGDPIDYWRDQEDAGGDYLPMQALRLILDAPHGRWEMASGGGSEYWVWPRLAVMNPEETPPDELEAAIREVVDLGVHSAAQIEDMVYHQGYYLGFRTQIEVRDGTARWVAFVAGD